MQTKRLRSFLKRHPVPGPVVLAQWLAGKPHEDEFRLFESVADLPNLVVDVGANRGQSAVSILRRTRRTQVLSFEPNHALRFSLCLLRLLHPIRFRFRISAVGAEMGEATLFIPGHRGSGLSPQAALDPSEFQKAPTAKRLRAAGVDACDLDAFRVVPVTVITLDGLGLQPDVVKIDTEGSEFEVLKGMQETLDRHRPALLIEVNDTHLWTPWLRDRGYRIYRYDAGDDTLRPLRKPEEVLNLVGLHPDSPSPVSPTWSTRITAG